MFTLTLNTDQINTVLAALDAGVHKTVRPVIDIIITQVNEQQAKRAVEPVEVTATQDN